MCAEQGTSEESAPVEVGGPRLAVPRALKPGRTWIEEAWPERRPAGDSGSDAQRDSSLEDASCRPPGLPKTRASAFLPFPGLPFPGAAPGPQESTGEENKCVSRCQ